LSSPRRPRAVQGPTGTDARRPLIGAIRHCNFLRRSPGIVVKSPDFHWGFPPLRTRKPLPEKGLQHRTSRRHKQARRDSNCGPQTAQRKKTPPLRRGFSLTVSERRGEQRERREASDGSGGSPATPLLNGAGGNRTPVPIQSAGRVYVHSRLFDLGLSAAGDGVCTGPGRRTSRSAEACQPLGASPMVVGVIPYRASGMSRAASYAARAYCGSAVIGLHPFYVARMLHGTQRPAFPVRSKPDRPQLSKNP